MGLSMIVQHGDCPPHLWVIETRRCVVCGESMNHPDDVLSEGPHCPCIDTTGECCDCDDPESPTCAPSSDSPDE